MPVYTATGLSALTDVKEYTVHVEGLQDGHSAIANVHFGELGGAKQHIVSADVFINSGSDTGIARTEFEPSEQIPTNENIVFIDIPEAQQFSINPVTDFNLNLNFSTPTNNGLADSESTFVSPQLVSIPTNESLAPNGAVNFTSLQQPETVIEDEPESTDEFIDVSEAETETSEETSAPTIVPIDNATADAPASETTVEPSIDTTSRATITGDDAGSILEDTASVSGALNAVDINAAQSEFITDTVAGTYGTLTINESGEWSYALNNSSLAVQGLPDGNTLSDTVIVTTVDGTEHQIVLTITGTNDLPVITGDITNTLTDDTASVTGRVFAEDIDTDESSFHAESIIGTYGGLTIEADGSYTYLLDNNIDAVANLENGTSLTDTLIVTTADGTEQEITLTINGTNDAPIITGDRTNTIAEDTATVAGTLTNSGENDFSTGTIAGTYGSLAITSDGSYTYTLDNTDSDVQALAVGDSLTDTITVTTTDGRTQDITLTVNGTNDVPMITGDTTNTIAEDTATVTGTVTATDVDNGESSFDAETISGTYGSLAIAEDGSYTYTLDNSNSDVQALAVGDALSDTITVTTADGTTQDITLTVNGTNDVPTISGDTTNTILEDTATVTGTVTATDVDNGESSFDAETISGTYGSLAIAEDGSYTYTLDNSNTDVQALAVGDALTDTITVTTADGTTQDITLTVNGTNDVPTISGDTTNTISEDTATVTGTVTASDVDNGESSFDAETISGTYGSLAIAEDGSYTYTLDNSNTDVQALAVGDALTDTITVTTADGTTQDITLTVNGTNDVPTISGDTTNTISEDTATVTGTVTASDVDNGESSFDAETISGTYGSLAIAEDGSYTYTLDNSNTDVQALAVGDALTDTITVTTADGTTQDITLTVNGSNDAPTITGDTTNSIAEDTATVTGTVTATDVDAGESSFDAETVVGTYGSLAIAEDGSYTYTLDNSDSAVQALGIGDSLTDTITVSTADGTTQDITLTVNGTNDVPTISGDTTNTISEDTTTVTGTVTASDVDNGESSFDAETISGTYGSLAIAEDGSYTYTLDNSNTDVQALAVGDALTDTITVTTADGTTQDITLTVNGTNDVPTISGDTTNTISEDTATVTGTVTATDVDNGESSFDAETISGTYGSLAIAEDGSYTYTLDNSNTDVQALAVGDALTDTITVTTADGTTQDITLTVNGTNDVPTISGDTTNTISEDTATVTGTVIATDVDNGESSFAAETISGTYGSLAIAEDGSYTYTLDNSNTDVQALGIGDSLTDTISVTTADGTTQDITLTVNGSNDVPTITGDTTNSIAEDTATVTGTVTATDVDAGESSFDAETVVGTYGSLAIAEDGSYTYTLDNSDSAVQALGIGDSLTDTITVSTADGTTQDITLTVNGTNDVPTISGDTTNTISEDTTTVTGTVTASDVDNGESSFDAETISGTYGSLAIAEDGSYTYTLDNSNTDVQALAVGDSLTDTISVTTADGTTQDITLTVKGTNDVPTISGDTTNSMAEDTATVTGTVTATDVDNGESNFAAETVAGTYGSLTIAEDGSYTYTLNNNDSAVQALSVGDSLTDTISVTTADGTTQEITLTVNGSNDAPTITGDTTNSMAEDTATVTGTVTASDVDNGESSFDAETISGTYGSLAITEDGSYTYTLDNSNTDVQALAVGDALTDTISVTTADGTTQDITLTVNGTNDVPTISGDTTNTISEDTTTVTGTVTATDVDAGESSFDAETVVGTYGSLAIAEDGSYTYTLDNSNTDVQALAVGDALTDTISVTTADGTTQDITLTVNGSNDVPTISGDTTNTISEDTASVTGTVTATDVDNGESSFAAETVVGTYGSLAIAEDGSYTYTLDNSNTDVQALAIGDSLTDTISVTTADGTTQEITLTVNGSNDAPTITGDTTNSIAEDTATVTGTVTATDVDNGESSFTAETVAGTYGSLAIAEDGSYTYALDNNDSAVQALAVGDSLTDTISVTTADGTTQDITLTVKGTNDVPTISGDTTNSMAEDTATVTGTVTATDVDNGESDFAAETVAGTYGSLTIAEDGSYTYTLNNNDSAVQALSVGDSLTDTISVTTADGTTQDITLTVKGTNDVPTISGDTTNSMAEDTATVTGTVTATDVDNGESNFAAETVAGTYGSLTIAEDGSYTYTLNNNDSAVQALSVGDSLTDTISVTTADGTTQDITLTVKGTNDVPTISGDTTNSMGEDTATVTGTVTATDVDNGESNFAAETVVGTYGSLAIAEDGSYTYTLNNNDSAVQALGVGDSLTDTITITTADGTSQDITLTVKGTNDGPVANIDTATTAEDSSITIDVLANDTDTDSGDTQAITTATISGSNNGSVSIVNGELVYDPGSDFTSLDEGESETVTINYTMQDSQGATSTSSVTVTVTGVDNNSPPIAVADTATTSENSILTIDVLANDSDLDVGDDLTVTMATIVGDDNGAVGIVDNQLVFNPGTDFDSLALGQSREVVVNYTVSDGTASTMSTVTITVSGANDAPTAIADTASTLEDRTLTFDVLDNDTDIDTDDTLSLVSASIEGSDDSDDSDSGSSEQGTISIVDGQIVFDPGDDFDDLEDGESSIVVVNYTLQDAAGVTSSSTLTITVNGEDEGLEINGSKHDDTLTGSGLDDTMDGKKGDDTLYGEAGDDIIDGDKGDDTIEGGAGADVIDGGQDTDTASYANSSEAVNVNLTTGTGTGGDAEGDTLSNVENLFGSAHNDVFTGDSGDNVITGGLGSDTYNFSAGSGDDVFSGGDGAWTDIINLNNISTLPGEGDWTLQITNGATYNVDTENNVLEFDSNATGSITIGGDTLSFDDVEKITWAP